MPSRAAIARRLVLRGVRRLERLRIAGRRGIGDGRDRDGASARRRHRAAAPRRRRHAPPRTGCRCGHRPAPGWDSPARPGRTSPSSTSASAIAYWPPRRKPLVPSTGSSVHHRPRGPPVPAQRASARSAAASSMPGRTRASCSPSAARIAAGAPSRTWLASSSPMTGSVGNASPMARLMSTWAPRSATVTGERSAFWVASASENDARTERHSRAADRTASRATCPFAGHASGRFRPWLAAAAPHRPHRPRHSRRGPPRASAVSTSMGAG